jgi:hypothetical protein
MKEKDKKDFQEIKQNNPIKYYKTFTKKPTSFKNLYVSSSDEYSSSDESQSSSDGFPSPTSPGKDSNYNEIFEKVKELQYKLQKSEIENKKLRAKNKKL